LDFTFRVNLAEYASTEVSGMKTNDMCLSPASLSSMNSPPVEIAVLFSNKENPHLGWDAPGLSPERDKASGAIAVAGHPPGHVSRIAETNAWLCPLRSLPFCIQPFFESKEFQH